MADFGSLLNLLIVPCHQGGSYSENSLVSEVKKCHAELLLDQTAIFPCENVPTTLLTLITAVCLSALVLSIVRFAGGLILSPILNSIVADSQS